MLFLIQLNCPTFTNSNYYFGIFKWKGLIVKQKSNLGNITPIEKFVANIFSKSKVARCFFLQSHIVYDSGYIFILLFTFEYDSEIINSWFALSWCVLCDERYYSYSYDNSQFYRQQLGIQIWATIGNNKLGIKCQQTASK